MFGHNTNKRWDLCKTRLSDSYFQSAINVSKLLKVVLKPNPLLNAMLSPNRNVFLV